MSIASDADYKVRCLEKENDRLIESVKQTRQNALALLAAVLILVGAVLEIGKPLGGGLKNAQYDGSIQVWLLGAPQTPERDVAIQRLTCLWNIASLSMVVSGSFTILLAIGIFIKSAKFTPDLGADSLKSITKESYLDLLLRQRRELIKLHQSYRRYLIGAACGALLTVFGCGLIILTWLWFGGAVESVPKVIGGTITQ